MSIANKSTNELVLLLNSPLIFDAPQHSTNSVTGKALVAEINKAHTSIDFAIYGMRDQNDIYEALVNAKGRGVEVRGIVDKDINDKNYYTSTNQLLSTFKNINTDFKTDKNTKRIKDNEEDKYKSYCQQPPGFKGPLQCVGYSLPGNKCLLSSHASREPLEFKGDIMHNKFFVIDKKVVWTGSTNLIDSGTGGYNANNAVIIRNIIISKWYTEEFEQMYSYWLFHRDKTKFKKKTMSTQLSDGTKIGVEFSPQSYSMERTVRPLIKSAKKYIDLPVFFLTHKKVAGDLIAAHQRGVKVRVIIDATAATNGYTKHELLRAAGIPVKVENWGGKMHMKTAVFDGKKMVLGSMNWTSAGERTNDENTLIIESTKYSNQMHDFFNKMWASIPEKWLKNSPVAESLDSNSACFDEVDNDFDHLVDKEDPSCQEGYINNQKLPAYRIVKKGSGMNLIKGNISKGRKIYQTPGSKYYDNTRIDTDVGERWFCSVYDARENGWKSYREFGKNN